MRLHKRKCKTRCSPEKNLLPLLFCLPVNAHIFDFLLMPLRRDPNYPSAVKHLFLHSHEPAARLRPGTPLGMSLVTLSCHRYTDHPSLPFVNKERLSMVPVWKNLFSLFCDKCEGHYLCHGQRYWMLLMRNQTRCRNTESGNRLVCFRPKNVVCDGEVHRLTAESGVQWETSCVVILQCV